MKRSRLLIAVVSLGLLGALGVPTAAQAAPRLDRTAAVPAKPYGAIVCNRDLCLQTLSVNVSNCSAVVKTWANTSNFYGHFEIFDPINDEAWNSYPGNTTYYAGGAGYDFSITYYGNLTSYQATAWKHNSNGKYADIGQLNFVINANSAC